MYACMYRQFISYLPSRFQRVTTGASSSKAIRIYHGVLQGSVRGPVMHTRHIEVTDATEIRAPTDGCTLSVRVSRISWHNVLSRTSIVRCVSYDVTHLLLPCTS